MISYELAQKLKDAGFPIHKYEPAGDYDYCWTCGEVEQNCLPPLSELIEACGQYLDGIIRYSRLSVFWQAHSNQYSFDEKGHIPISGFGQTPEEAVIDLWLSLRLNKKI